jgi:two-component system, chemotaxis family, chemotaxis protein CheY
MQKIPQHANCTIMIVDDELAVRELLRAILEMSGYSVVAEATDGVEAVALYLELRPEITLMDLCMPNKNGIDATKEIVAIDENAKVVIVSGINAKDLVKTAHEAGAKGALSKPVKLSALKEVLHRVRQM